jgi:hypothetical protein
MSQTKINGVKIDVRLLNQALALKLEEALSELHSSEQNRKNEKTNILSIFLICFGLPDALQALQI